NNLFLTPERKPFFAGSYFPPEDDDFGRPGFQTILARIGEAWTKERGELLARAEIVAESLRRRTFPVPAVAAEPERWRREAATTLLARIDSEHGGLKSGGAAKFPLAPELGLLATDKQGIVAVRRALDAMARSAMRDHLGGGFHRYTIDPRWNQPHFEKMLYDNAQLLRLYATAGRGRPHREVALQTADFLLREMQAPEGGFYASFDAVSADREGAHYLWDEQEIRAVLGPAANGFLAAYRIVPLPGHLDQPLEDSDRQPGALRMRDNTAGTAPLAAARAKLLRHRAQRPGPARDDKIILAWNGLAIEALAVAGKKLAAPRLTTAARRAAERLWRDAWEPATGRLRQALFEGRAQGEGFLEDYALFGLGLLALDERERAATLAAAMLARFGRADGGLAETVHAAELFAPAPESGDGPYAAGASAAYRLLARLAAYEPRFGANADKLLAALSPLVARAPDHWPALLVAPIAAPSGPAADIAGSAGVVSATSRWLATAGAERRKRLVVTLRIAPGWHVNASSAKLAASLDYLIPTRLVFAGAQPRAVRYPKAEAFRAAFAGSEISVYSGTVDIEADFVGKRPASARLTVQACSDEVCLPPAELGVTSR
ncbi:MAG: DUF255 domain-containing protein, partial [Rhodocyclaceae bacterium]|nr:DUF255 domain-containing protein [Rhodocyclaceae bacterium]